MDVEVTFWQGSTQTKAKPDHPCEDGEESDDGDEHACDHVRDPLDWGTAGLTLANDTDDVVQPVKMRSVASSDG